MSLCLGASQADMRLLHNADRSLRIGRWLRLAPSLTGYAEQVNYFTRSGLYSSSSIFQASRMTAARNSAVTKSFAAPHDPGLTSNLFYSWYQDWDYMYWDNNGWVIPPNFYNYDFYAAAATRYRYTVPSAELAGETIAGIMLEISGTGHGTGQDINHEYIMGSGTNGELIPTRIGPLNSPVVFDFHLSGAQPTNANFTTPDATIDCDTGNYVSALANVPFLYDWPHAWYDDVGYKGVIPLKLDSARIKNLFSSQHIYLTVRPRLMSNYSILGSINYWGGSLNPNQSSVLNFMNNRTAQYTQMANSCFYYPELYVYAH